MSKIQHIALTILSFILPLHAQYYTTHFDNITMKDGLSGNDVRAILKDRNGFMWFGTDEGLNRYDGYTFKVYKYDPDDSLSISSNNISSLCEDHNGTLWVGTNDNVLNKFDENTEKFTRYKLTEEYNNYILSIIEDPYENEGVLWLGTRLGLIKVYADRIITKQVPGFFPGADTAFVKLYPKGVNGLYGAGLLTMCDAQNIWLGSGYGLAKFNKSSETVKRCLKNKATRETDFMVTNMHQDDEGILWLGTASDGLAKFDPSTEEFTLYKNNSGDPFSIGSNTVRSINEDAIGKLWVLTPGIGYFQFDKKTEKFFCYKRAQTYSRIGSALGGIAYLDNGGIHWIGSQSDGIFKYAPHKEKFNLHNLSSGAEATVKVQGIYKDKTDTLWVSSIKELYKIDTKTGEHRIIKYDPGHRNNLYQHSILWFYEDKDGFLWLGTDGGGLKRYNFLSKETKEFYIDPKTAPGDTYTEWNNYIMGFIEDKNDRLIIATYGGNYTFIFNKITLLYENPRRGALSYFFVDRAGDYYAGTALGLCKLAEDYSVVEHYVHNPNDPHSISNDYITSIYEDKFNNLWIGTTRGGLNLFNREKQQFTSFLEKDGLASDRIWTILEDDEGNLWLATPKGITRFTPKKVGQSIQAEIKNYNISSMYPTGVSYKDENGVLYFGGKSGFLSFHPDSLKKNTAVPKIVITDFRLFDKSVKPTVSGNSILSKRITETKEIVLAHDQNFFSFEFAALDYTNSMKNKYAYKMDGIDNDWIYTDARRRFVNYTKVQPGEYTFNVKGSNNDGVWNEEGVSLKIIITPPWWKTTWAYGTYLILIIFTVAVTWYLQLRRIRIKHNLEMEHMHAEKLEEVDRLKSRFFANISHEFRTPLTLILGPISKILERFVKEDTQRTKKVVSLPKQETFQELTLVRRNANRLLELINQLLDLSKLDAGRMQLHATETDMIPLLKGLVMSFASLAERKKITLKFHTSVKELLICLDKDKFEKIINNLLSNAFKFTPEDGDVGVTLKIPNPKHQIPRNFQIPNSQFLIPNSDFVEITITNTGPLIPPDKLDKIFDRFRQLQEVNRADHHGSGIGLALTKELVELHHGTISVESKIDDEKASSHGKDEDNLALTPEHKAQFRGEDFFARTSFTITFPLGRDHLSENEIFKETSIDLEEVKSSQQETMRTEHQVPSIEYQAMSNKNRTPDIEHPVSSILVVEDNADVRQYIKNNLTDFTVFEAEDGRIGLDLTLEKMPDLIISDVMMPNMDGFEMCQKIKEDERISHIPIILLTARAEKADKISGWETGADEYIAKPFDTEELSARVANLIEQRERLKKRFHNEAGMPLHKLAVTSTDQKFLYQIQEILDREMDNPDFHVDTLLNELHISRTHLFNKLKSLTGMSANQFIRMIRLKRAALLLESHTGNISEISYAVGFNNPAYFSECFRKQFGITPSYYATKINL